MLLHPCREKLKRINEVRDPRGFRQYITDAVSAAASGGGNGGHVGHKLIGSVEIPLRSIPASGFNR